MTIICSTAVLLLMTVTKHAQSMAVQVNTQIADDTRLPGWQFHHQVKLLTARYNAYSVNGALVFPIQIYELDLNTWSHT